MNYVVKITAKPDTWFKAGTEVFIETNDFNRTNQRISYKEFLNVLNNCGTYPATVFYGIHVIDDAIDAKNRGGNIGDEVEDGEFCPFDEFIFEIINLDAKFGQ
jgi:hypothetical protein